MNEVTEYIEAIENPDHREKFGQLIAWMQETFPKLDLQIKWNQPMFIDHGTFIIGFSVSKMHFGVGPEPRTFNRFLPEIEKAGLKHGKKTFQVQFKRDLPKKLLKEMVEYTLVDKKDVDTFWDKRKVEK